MRPVLVLDMDETLMHAEHMDDGSITVLHRPGLKAFLESVARLYNLVLYTAGTRRYATAVMGVIDPGGLFQLHLYREHCVVRENGTYAKDLHQIPGIDVERTIAVDDIPENYCDTQPDNVVRIAPFMDNPRDRELERLTPMLEQFAFMKLPVVVFFSQRKVCAQCGRNLNLSAFFDSLETICMACQFPVMM